MKTSIIVIAYGYTPYIIDCIKPLNLNNCKDYELIVSWDSSFMNLLQEEIFDLYPTTTFINSSGCSIARCLNMAHSCSRGDFVLQLNDDVEFVTPWQRLENPCFFDFIGGVPTNYDYEKNGVKVTFPLDHETQLVEQLYGYCIYSSRENFAKFPYDENLPNYAWVDLDFNYRVTTSGLKLGIKPDVIVKHKRENLTPKLLEQVPYYKDKYGDDFIKKHFKMIYGENE